MKAGSLFCILAMAVGMVVPAFASVSEPYICTGYPVPEIAEVSAVDKNLNLPNPRIEDESKLIHSEAEPGMCSGYPVPPKTDMVDVDSVAESTFVPLISQEPRGVLSYITVYISSPCDQYWRNAFPNNWMYMANYAVEEGITSLLTSLILTIYLLHKVIGIIQTLIHMTNIMMQKIILGKRMVQI